MRLFSRGTLDCPECGCAAVLRIFAMYFAAFQCPRCGCRGFGHVRKVPISARKPGDVEVKMVEVEACKR